jgi:glycine oxidase
MLGPRAERAGSTPLLARRLAGDEGYAAGLLFLRASAGAGKENARERLARLPSRSVATPSPTRTYGAPRARPLPDVVIVGAGIIGCALARELAGAGARVTLVDRGEPGGEASSAAAGMLGPQAECDGPTPLLGLGMASRALYPEIVAALREETGIDPEYQDDGIVYVALSEEEEAVLARRAAWQRAAGYRVDRLRAEDVRRLAPGLTDEVRSALLFPDDHRVDNVRLTRAYAAACAARGVAVRPGFTVARVRCEGGRAIGVEGGGEMLAAGAVVNAAGAWAAATHARGARRLPVGPVRGQMVLLAGPEAIFRHAVYSREVYLVPRRDGRLLAGSTYEDAGFDKRVTASAVGAILGRTLRLAPVLADCVFREAWAGLRPATPDRLPVLGADPEIAGLHYAVGHYRSGILLAPVTARALAELVLDGKTAYDLAPFAADRLA